MTFALALENGDVCLLLCYDGITFPQYFQIYVPSKIHQA